MAAAAPDPWLPFCSPALRPGTGRVLDLACGAGRHSLWLAERGFRVQGTDASAERVAAARDQAQTRGLSATFAVAEVAPGSVPPGPWDGVCVFHFLDRGLFPELARSLVPGGWLLYKTHLDHPGRPATARPRNPLYRLQPGELLGAFPALTPVWYREWLAGENAWAGLLARRYSS